MSTTTTQNGEPIGKVVTLRRRHWQAWCAACQDWFRTIDGEPVAFSGQARAEKGLQLHYRFDHHARTEIP